MKIERISENQIKCTLFRSDFEDRHLTIKDFFGGSEKARKLFADVLKEAGEEYDFYVENVPVMIEAVPAAKDSLTVFITRVDDAEEAASRFKAHPRPEELLRSLEKIIGALGVDKGMIEDSDSFAFSDSSSSRAFVYSSLDEVKLAAGALARIFFGKSSLYRHPASGQYYLVLSDDSISSGDFDMICNSIVEYGAQIKNGRGGETYYSEHYKTVYNDDAIASLTK